MMEEEELEQKKIEEEKKVKEENKTKKINPGRKRRKWRKETFINNTSNIVYLKKPLCKSLNIF